MGWSARREEGTPQGGPLSPLLSNLMLDVLDKELEKRGHRFVRYADDCNIYVRSQRAGERVMESIEQFLAKRLKLRVNKAKSAVAKPNVRKFLGFSFTGGKQPRRRIAPQAIDRFKARVRELTRRTGGKQPLASRQGAVVLPHRMARLLRLLRDPFSVARPRPVDQAAAARHRLEAVEARAYPLCESCDAAASAGTWRRKPPAAHTALGGSATAPRSPLPCQTPSSPALGLATLAPKHAA